MTREQRIAQGIDRALDNHYSKLTPWEVNFLSSLRKIYQKQRSLSVTQKTHAMKTITRLGISIAP